MDEHDKLLDAFIAIYGEMKEYKTQEERDGAGNSLRLGSHTRQWKLLNASCLRPELQQ